VFHSPTLPEPGTTGLDSPLCLLYNAGIMTVPPPFTAKWHLQPLFCALLICFSPIANAAADGLTHALDQILDAPALKGGITGAVVQRVGDGQMLYEHNADTRLLPASNRKLFTAAAALELLGDDFTYTTQVRATAKPDADGTLHGDLVLHGVGDSSLKTADLDDLAAQVAKAGVRRIIGSVIGDGSVFTDGPYGFGWEWDDFDDEEFPQIAGLEVDDGDVAVQVAPGAAVGAPAAVTLEPPTGYVPLFNQTTTADKDTASSLQIVRPYAQNGLRITGRMPVGKTATQNLPVEDPPRYTATVFALCLTRHGITMTGSTTEVKASPDTPIILASHTSIPLAPYLALMNKPSDNLLAESLIRTLGAVKGQGGTYDAGHAVEMPFFQKLGVDVASIALVDGCGVGRRNFVTARAVGQLLVGMHRQSDWKVYYDSLPIAGVDGTLKRRMKGTKAEGNVHAKTGTLSQVRGLSGYLTGSKGEVYAFSLLMNNFPGTATDAGQVQDNFVEYLAAHL
jgi:D-alanyl-D-alanine carboxypeptidase/D-alanyl-D-alanine-endopeptidase (penicillin-binding protein 4)